MQGILVIPFTSNPLKYIMRQDINNVYSLQVLDIAWDTTMNGAFNPFGLLMFLSCPDFSYFGASHDGRFGDRIVPNIVATWVLTTGTLANEKTQDQPCFEINYEGNRTLHELNFALVGGDGTLLAVPGRMNLLIKFKQHFPVRYDHI